MDVHECPDGVEGFPVETSRNGSQVPGFNLHLFLNLLMMSKEGSSDRDQKHLLNGQAAAAAALTSKVKWEATWLHFQPFGE